MVIERIRRGGIQTAQGFLFELSGGDIALDFINTVDMRPQSEPKELLCTYGDLCSWARQAGILTRTQEEQLLRQAKNGPGKAKNVLRFAIELRECMFQIFKLVTDEEESVPEHLLKQWNAYVHRSIQEHRLVRTKDGLSWKYFSDGLKLDSMLWPVIHSAVELLTGPMAPRIRRCASDKCDWLFLDTSKRGNRRWCDMTVCGNRAKAQRFYSKKISNRKDQD